MKRLLITLGVLATFTLTACADVVDGSGSEATSALSSGSFPTDSTGPTDTTDTPDPTPTDDPTTSSSSPTDYPDVDFRCPGITYLTAKMSFECISDAMRVGSGKVFPTIFSQVVESASGWTMEMGAMRYDGSGTSFPAISAEIRGDLLDAGGYGPDPDYELDSVDYSTITGKRAYTTIDTVTVDPSYTASKKSKVKVEKRWLVIVEVESGSYVAWYASIPDVAQQYWARVPTSIASIKINA